MLDIALEIIAIIVEMYRHSTEDNSPALEKIQYFDDSYIILEN